VEKILAYSPVVLIGIFLVLLILERAAPLRAARHSLLKRLVVNFCIIALAFAVNKALVQTAAAFTLQWTQQQPLGLLYLVELPVWLRSAIAFLLMDLTFYYWHRANHRFPFLWHFHNAYHIDPELDVSTGFRFHFVEIALSTSFRIAQIALIGVSAWVYAFYEVIYQANTLFHHSNVRLPLWLERRLNWILVTPRMHGIHHSQVQQETNSNYSVVFPWWDRLHQTLRLNVPQSAIRIGVPAYSNSEDNQLGSILTMPFRKQRDYWCRPDQIPVARLAVLADQTHMVDSEAVSLSRYEPSPPG